MNQKKWPLVANTQISEYLKKSLYNNRVGGAYIFCGPENLGKKTLSKFFVQIILCQKPNKSGGEILPCYQCSSCKRFAKNVATTNYEQKDLSEIHGDFHVIKKDKDKKNISIEQIRDFVHTLNLSSFSNGYKVGIIDDADTLSNEAANSLLKTLEEPKKKVLIMLIVKNKESLPATIISRSQVLQFRPVVAEQIYEYLINDHNIPREKARNISRLSLGRPALAVKFLENEEFYNNYNDKVKGFIDMQTNNLAARFRQIENFFDKKASNQENVSVAHEILNIWQGVVRDYLLISFGMQNRIQHVYVQDRLSVRGDMQIPNYLQLSRLMMEAHRFLDANVNPRLVLENLAINI